MRSGKQQIQEELFEIYSKMTDPELRKKEDLKKKREERRKQVEKDYL